MDRELIDITIQTKKLNQLAWKLLQISKKIKKLDKKRQLNRLNKFLIF